MLSTFNVKHNIELNQTTYEVCSHKMAESVNMEESENKEESEERHWYTRALQVLKLPSIKVVSIAMMTIAVGISMVATGALYNKECVNSRATLFSIVTGCFALVLTLSAFMASFIKEAYYNFHRYKSVWWTIASFGYFIINTWGTVEVFGRFTLGLGIQRY